MLEDTLRASDPPLHRCSVARCVRPIRRIMRAAAINRFGPPSVLSIRDLPMPQPSPVEVVIALEWAGVGSWDASIRDGSWAEGRTKFPLVPGLDGAGVVVARGARVRRLTIGDRVYAYEFGNSKGGFYAQYAAVHANHADRVPQRSRYAGRSRDGDDCPHRNARSRSSAAPKGIEQFSYLERPAELERWPFRSRSGTEQSVIATASGRPATRIVSATRRRLRHRRASRFRARRSDPRPRQTD